MTSPPPPNILLICTDQQRYDTLGSSGNPHVRTPTLDRLAGEGVLFDNCYVQNPVCAPSRASLMTGRYVHSHGLWANGVSLPERERLFTRTLADAGYDCGLIGKLHLSACEDGRTEVRHDDGFRTFRWAHDPYPGSAENRYHQWLRATRPDLYAAAMDPESPVTFDTLPTEAHYSHWVGTEAVAFLSAHEPSAAPFCLVVNFFDPHHGFGAPAAYQDRYEPAALPPPVTRPDELADAPPIYSEVSKESYAGQARGYASYSPAELQQVKAAYYAMVELVDDEVARILAALEAAGQARDTLVVFTSDHGEMLGDHQLMLKGPMMYEPAVRVPLILRWPDRLPAGVRRSDPVQWVDLAPTLLAAAGAPRLPAGQGQSLLGLARGEADARPRDWALSEYRNSGHPYDPPVHTTMLRAGPHKLVVHHGAPATTRTRTGELYDLVADPDELHNRWDDPGYAAVRMAMLEQLVDVLVATEDRSAPRDADW